MASTTEAAGDSVGRPLVWACAAFAGGVLLHLDRVPPWAPAIALLLISWRLAGSRAPRLPGTAARALLALVLAALVLLRFHTLNGLTAGTVLLMLMAALKLLETRTQRDQWVLVGAGLFLLLAACLDRQDLIRAPWYALQAWLCLSALAVITASDLPWRAALSLTGRALLLAVPLAVLLFLFFPRLPGSFWSIPRGDQAVTGLSDTMSPGSISSLATSYDPAFRVQFVGDAPPSAERYFRGPVLHEFDGRTWRRGPGVFRPRQRLEYLGSAYRYRVALEPSRQRWWFALDTPSHSPEPGVLLTYDNQLLAAEPVTEPLTFEAVSYTHTRSREPLGSIARQQDTALPAGANPRSLALAHTLRERAGSEAEFVQGTLDYLRTGGFVYTLTPELLRSDPVDDFLFNTREGFCGHYASAFATLMRAGGVPAHVVTGYLGGEWNPIGGFFLVRQSDAHAWTEVWLEDRGWVRVDPTAVVAPERLRRGVFDLLPEAFTARVRLLHGSPWLLALQQRWDATNAWWSEHVVKFDLPMQLDLLARLGVRAPQVRYLGWAFMLALGAWLAAIAWQSSRGNRPARSDALARAYLRLCRKLQKIGPPRERHQGPLAYAAILCAHRPDLREPVLTLLLRYARLRYGPGEPRRTAEVEAFRRAVARLSLPRAPSSAT